MLSPGDGVSISRLYMCRRRCRSRLKCTHVPMFFSSVTVCSCEGDRNQLCDHGHCIAPRVWLAALPANVDERGFGPRGIADVTFPRVMFVKLFECYYVRSNNRPAARAFGLRFHTIVGLDPIAVGFSG